MAETMTPNLQKLSSAKQAVVLEVARLTTKLEELLEGEDGATACCALAAFLLVQLTQTDGPDALRKELLYFVRGVADGIADHYGEPQ